MTWMAVVIKNFPNMTSINIFWQSKCDGKTSCSGIDYLHAGGKSGGDGEIAKT